MQLRARPYHEGVRVHQVNHKRLVRIPVLVRRQPPAHQRRGPGEPHVAALIGDDALRGISAGRPPSPVVPLTLNALHQLALRQPLAYFCVVARRQSNGPSVSNACSCPALARGRASAQQASHHGYAGTTYIPVRASQRRQTEQQQQQQQQQCRCHCHCRLPPCHPFSSILRKYRSDSVSRILQKNYNLLRLLHQLRLHHADAAVGGGAHEHQAVVLVPQGSLRDLPGTAPRRNGRPRQIVTALPATQNIYLHEKKRKILNWRSPLGPGPAVTSRKAQMTMVESKEPISLSITCAMCRKQS